MRRLQWGKGLFWWMRWLTMVCLLVGTASTSFAAKTYTDNGDGTVTDPTTGLTWMRCPMGRTISASGTYCSGTDTTYSWDQANALTGATTFAGNTDWRLPNIRELLTIVDRSHWYSAQDVTAFPNTASSTNLFWTSSEFVSSVGSAWFVNFVYGDTSNANKGLPNKAILVRGGQPLGLTNVATPTTDYVDHGDGTVTHIPSGLMWKHCSEGQTWTATTCNGTPINITSWTSVIALTSTFAGFNDWRLPTDNELLSLSDYSRASPAINVDIFPATPVAAEFWVATPYLQCSPCYWTVNSGDGKISKTYYGTTVRLVRAGKSPNDPALTVSKTGNGVVNSNPVGIICGSICSATYSLGTSVTLIAGASVGSTFAGWSGDCSGTGSCVVSMSSAKNVNATFTATPQPASMINISTRGQVQTGSNVMIGGFIIQGTTNQTVLIRAVGPNLLNYGVTGVLADPMLELHRSSDGAIIASNDNWGTASNAAAIQATGLAPVSPLESAILITLPPGAYTAIVSGANGGMGVGIVEVFAQ